MEERIRDFLNTFNNFEMISSGEHLLNSDFWTSGSNIDEYSISLAIKPGESPADFIKRICGSVCKIDCCLFVQFIIKLKHWKKEGNIHYYHIPIDLNHVVSFRAEINRSVKYIRPTNDEAHTCLQRSENNSKGQWVVDCGNDKLCGLSDVGPAFKSLNDWANYLINKLKNEFGNYTQVIHLDTPSSEMIEIVNKNMISTLLKTGDINEWGLYLLYDCEQKTIVNMII